MDTIYSMIETPQGTFTLSPDFLEIIQQNVVVRFAMITERESKRDILYVITNIDCESKIFPSLLDGLDITRAEFDQQFNHKIEMGTLNCIGDDWYIDQLFRPNPFTSVENPSRVASVIDEIFFEHGVVSHVPTESHQMRQGLLTFRLQS